MVKASKHIDEPMGSGAYPSFSPRCSGHSPMKIPYYSDDCELNPSFKPCLLQPWLNYG
jgi:hypothetical protein